MGVLLQQGNLLAGLGLEAEQHCHEEQSWVQVHHKRQGIPYFDLVKSSSLLRLLREPLGVLK